MPRISGIFNNLLKLSIALDVVKDVIDGDVGLKNAAADSNCVARRRTMGYVRNFICSTGLKICGMNEL
jgi:hypothetical protein